jgi:hypothetical protein
MSTALKISLAVATSPVDRVGRKVYSIALKRHICHAFCMAKSKRKFCDQIKVSRGLIYLWINKHFQHHGFVENNLVVRPIIVKTVTTENLPMHLDRKERLEKQLSLF